LVVAESMPQALVFDQGNGNRGARSSISEKHSGNPAECAFAWLPPHWRTSEGDTAMATARRSEVVGIAALSKSIDKAVALAAKRHDVAIGGDNIILNWEILGRILKEMKAGGRDTRLDVANTILKNVPGVKGQPVVTKIGKDILVGFIERVGNQYRF
jgi:hypothetical protein